eukprot:3682098-Pleurochrysis_carterae.AAC.1
MLNFTPAQRDQWRAIAAFHEEFSCSDQVPHLPLTIRAPPSEAETTSSWTIMHGSPFSWSEAWSKLSFRYPRPHAPSQPSPAAATSSTEQQVGDGAAEQQTAASQRRVRDDSAIINGVTGINAPRSARRQALGIAQQDTTIDALGISRTTVAVGELVFVGVPGVFEGEFAVGLGRITSGPDQDGDVQVEWLKRVGMSYTPGTQGYSWKGSPTFHAWVTNARTQQVSTNTQPLSDILPVPVRLTNKSTHFENLPLTHKEQKIRLTAKTVAMLRQFCEEKLPNLYCAAAAASAGAPAAPSGRASSSAAL